MPADSTDLELAMSCSSVSCPINMEPLQLLRLQPSEPIASKSVLVAVDWAHMGSVWTDPSTIFSFYTLYSTQHTLPWQREAMYRKLEPFCLRAHLPMFDQLWNCILLSDLHDLRIPDSYDAKIAEICNIWTLGPVIQLMNHLFKIRQCPMLHRCKRLFVRFWKDCILAELHAIMSKSCRFLLFSHHNYQVSLKTSPTNSTHAINLQSNLKWSGAFKHLKIRPDFVNTHRC